MIRLVFDEQDKFDKHVADQVAKLARSKLTTSEYMTPKQIKSLFSRWTKLRRLGQLKPPVDTDGSGEEEEEIDIENEVESDDDNHAEIQQEAV